MIGPVFEEHTRRSTGSKGGKSIDRESWANVSRGHVLGRRDRTRVAYSWRFNGDLILIKLRSFPVRFHRFFPLHFHRSSVDTSTRSGLKCVAAGKGSPNDLGQSSFPTADTSG